MTSSKHPYGTQQWLNETRGVNKLPGESDAEFNARMTKAETERANASASVVRNPKTGATFMVMPELPSDTRPLGNSRKRI